jgi:hypothetical protein
MFHIIISCHAHVCIDDAYAHEMQVQNACLTPRVLQLLYTHMTGEMKCPRLYLCLAHSIPSPPMSIQHMHQHDQQRYDPLHIIT